MRFLVIGLGSMGKRRIRNLQALAAGAIIGFDPREDRCEEVKEKYGIKTFTQFEDALGARPDAFIISTPPDLHMYYAHKAVEETLHFFTEASVTDGGMAELTSKLAKKKIVGVPSCTMRFFPGPRKIKQLISDRAIGEPLSFTYHSGQYLPDWHPWEDYRTFYVSNRETGACREIVPFELVWLNWVFGEIDQISCMKDRVGGLEADIDDIYQVLLKFQNRMIGHLMVDVLACPAVRHMRIVGTSGTIEWKDDQNVIWMSNGPGGDWDVIPLDLGTIEDRYINPEEPYIEEMREFVAAVRGDGKIGYTFEEDQNILGLLYTAEESSMNAKHVAVEWPHYSM